MKLKISAFILVLLISLISTAGVIAAPEGSPYTMDLIAGGINGTDVGEIQVWNDSENLYVTFVIDNELNSENLVPTLMYETNVAVGLDLDSIPQTKKGNPKIGNFEYKQIHDPGVTEYTYVIPVTWEYGTEIIVAAHAVVSELGGIDSLELTLPETVTMFVTYPNPDSYFDVVISNAGWLNGIYDSWCIDTSNHITPDVVYNGVSAFSSYGIIPGDVAIDHPENLPYVNWLINHYGVGDQSPGGLGTYSMCDLQTAIWALVDDDMYDCDGSDPDRVNELTTLALQEGSGFVPGCGEKLAIVLANPGNVQTVIQVITLGIDIPCETTSETAWANGIGFPGKQWAMYITYMFEE